MLEKILVIDDEEDIRELLAALLRKEGFEVSVAEDGEEAMQLMKAEHFDLVFTDMMLHKSNGLDVIRKARECYEDMLLVVMTAHGSVENAVEAMQLGAFHYLLKPFSQEIVKAILQKAKEQALLVRENTFLKEEKKGRESHDSSAFVAESVVMKKLAESLGPIAESHASVFITGESGTGKEVIASAIHHLSPRKDCPFIRINCAAIPETLIEAEFFGHEKGAFTGAHARKPGRFELANHGTLLLDEVTEVPMAIQAKLLRVIQEGEFERLGGTKSIKVDVRLIATSNRNLEEALQNKVLREDLYYRLNVIPLHLPPLRERTGDILPLAFFFLDKFAQENHKEKATLSKEAEEKLLAYSWPGNVRELANVMERAIVMSQKNVISANGLAIHAGAPLLTLKELEQKHILEALQACDQDHAKAAEHLGISPKELLKRLEGHALPHSF